MPMQNENRVKIWNREGLYTEEPDSRITILQKRQIELEKELQKTRKKLDDVSNELYTIKYSFEGKLFFKLGALVRRMFPIGSSRRRAVKWLICTLSKVFKSIRLFYGFKYRKMKRWAASIPVPSIEQEENGMVSIILISFNRYSDTRRCIRTLYRRTKAPFELIVLDNNSKKSTQNKLGKFVGKLQNARLIQEEVNLGCAGGRKKAMEFASGKYVFFLDNDIIVLPNYLEHLLSRIQNEPNCIAACCKVIYPDGLVQYNGGELMIDDGFAIYNLSGLGLAYDSPESQLPMECDWMPGGASLWRREWLAQFSFDEEMVGSYEDNELSIRIRRAGYKLVNSPLSMVVHDHIAFKSGLFRWRENDYLHDRYNLERTEKALVHFYAKHRLIFSYGVKDDPWDKLLHLSGKTDILGFIQARLGQGDS